MIRFSKHFSKSAEICLHVDPLKKPIPIILHIRFNVLWLKMDAECVGMLICDSSTPSYRTGQFWLRKFIMFNTTRSVWCNNMSEHTDGKCLLVTECVWHFKHLPWFKKKNPAETGELTAAKPQTELMRSVQVGRFFYWQLIIWLTLPPMFERNLMPIHLFWMSNS